MGDYVLVPRVATAEMHRASVEDVPVYPAMGERWKAMLAARQPVDYEALAAEIFSGADVDCNGNLTISELTKRLSKVLP